MKSSSRRISIIIVILCISMLSVNGNAQRKRIAILDFTAENTSQSYANAVRNLFEAALFKENVVDILERNQMETILKEQGFSLSGCTDASCAVQIGKLLSADMVVTGSLNRLGNYFMNVKFVSVASSSIDFIESIEAPSESDLKDRVFVMAKKASRKLNGEREKSPLFDFNIIFKNINGDISLSAIYANPLGETDKFIDPSPGVNVLGEFDFFRTGNFFLLGALGGCYLPQKNSDRAINIQKISLIIGWAGPAVRITLPWHFAVQMNLMGGYSYTSRKSDVDTVESRDPAFLGELVLRYTIFAPMFISLRGGYLRVFYIGEDLTEILYGCGVGVSL